MDSIQKRNSIYFTDKIWRRQQRWYLQRISFLLSHCHAADESLGLFFFFVSFLWVDTLLFALVVGCWFFLARSMLVQIITSSLLVNCQQFFRTSGIQWIYLFIFCCWMLIFFWQIDLGSNVSCHFIVGWIANLFCQQILFVYFLLVHGKSYKTYDGIFFFIDKELQKENGSLSQKKFGAPNEKNLDFLYVFVYTHTLFWNKSYSFRNAFFFFKKVCVFFICFFIWTPNTFGLKVYFSKKCVCTQNIREIEDFFFRTPNSFGLKVQLHKEKLRKQI